MDIIKSGICLAQSNIQSHFGGDIPTNIKPSITVKIVATGLGNQEPGGGGACCTALNESGARPFFDVLHSHWINGPPDPYPLTNHHLVTAAHEYTHAWQWSLGCLTIHNQPLGDWLNEGIAHYVSHDSLIRNGYMTTDAVRTFQLNSAIYAGEADVPLESLEGPGSPLWPGHIGYLAVEKLVSGSSLGPLSVRRVCEQIRNGLSVNQAFENAFGVTKSNFYATFPAYIDSLRGTSTP